MRKYSFIITLLCFFSDKTSAQKIFIDTAAHLKIDSLKIVLLHAKDSIRVDCLNALSAEYNYMGDDSLTAENRFAIPYSYASQAKKEASAINYKKGLAWAYLYLGESFITKISTNKAKGKSIEKQILQDLEESMNLAISLGEQLGEKRLLVDIYSDLIYLYSILNDQSKVETYARKALPYSRELGDEKKENEICVRICSQCLYRGEYEKGFEYCQRSVELAEKLAKQNAVPGSNKYNGGQSFFNMSRLYKIAGDYITALHFIRQAHDYYPSDSFWSAIWASEIGDIHRLLGNDDSASYYLRAFAAGDGVKVPNGKINLIYLYTAQKQYDKALPLINELNEWSKKRSDINGNGVAARLAGEVYMGMKDYRKALEYTREGLAISKRLNIETHIKVVESYQLLSLIFHHIGRNDSAYFYLLKYTNLRDSVLNRQFYWRLNNYKKEAEEERKTSQINLLNRDNKIKEQRLKQQAFVRNSLISGILLLFLLGVFVFRNLLLKRKNERLRMQKNLEVQQLESAKKQAELEMQALRAQMNPHFIFNCLSSINRFILKNESKIASNYLTRFSRLMRLVLMNSQKPLITLEDELQMLGLYLEMERLRFKNSFDYSITFLNVIESDNIFIPPLMFQPFCENAIWHGLMHKEGQGRLDIELSMQDNILNCTITDNGVGREKAEEMNSKTAEKEKSMGLKITTERLALLNKEKGLHTFYEIEDLKDENGNAAGTRIILKISFKESVEEAV